MPSACSASGCIASLWMLASGSQERARTDPRAHRPPCCHNLVQLSAFRGAHPLPLRPLPFRTTPPPRAWLPLVKTRTRDVHALNNAGFQSTRTRGLFCIHSQTAHFSKSRCFTPPCCRARSSSLVVTLITLRLSLPHGYVALATLHTKREYLAPLAPLSGDVPLSLAYGRYRSTPLRSVHGQEQRGTLPQSRVPLRFATLRPHFTRSIGRYRSTSPRTFQRTLERLDGASPARQKPARHKRIKPPFPPPRGIPLSRTLAGWSLSLPPLQVQRGVSNRSWGQGLDA